MSKREEMRNLETIPVGSLGIISLEGCKALGEKVNNYLVDWRTERKMPIATASHLRVIKGIPIC